MRSMRNGGRHNFGVLCLWITCLRLVNAILILIFYNQPSRSKRVNDSSLQSNMELEPTY